MSYTLPPELLLRIFELLLEQKPRRPISLLLFSSVRQLDCFTATCHRLIFRPSVLSITLPGGTADFRLFKLLHELVQRMVEVAPGGMSASEMVLRLRRIQLCLNSHMFDENCKYLSEALELTDPEEFIWTGPDPAHHFSTAIVPSAASYLFKAMHSWNSLRHLKLTNLACPRSAEGGPVHALAKALGAVDIGVLHAVGRAQMPDRAETVAMRSSPPMPHLQSIYLGQVTFLDPSEIATIACATQLISLNLIRIIDAYQGSIWGRRVRDSDIENAAMVLFSIRLPDQGAEGVQSASQRDCIERVKTLVSCGALTERIMGGDRMDSPD